MADRYADRYPGGGPLRREDDGYGHAPREQGESDPLAELARLIGQTDPFAALPDRAARARAPEPEEPPAEPAPPLPSWIQRVNHRAPAPSVHDEAPQQALGAAAYDDDDAAAEASDFLHGGTVHAEDAGAYDPHLDPSRYDEALYGPADQAYSEYGAQPDDGYGADQYGGQNGYADQNGDIGRPRRGRMATVFALVALAVVGTAGAYAYRTVMTAPRNTGDAPIIKADAGPNKVMPPAAQSTSDTAGKQIQDRAPAGQGGERLVSREEQPVDVNAPGTQRSGPRIVFPPLTTNPTAPPVDAAVQQQQPQRPPATPNSGLGEPRKVHTVAVRPDLTDATPPASAPSPAAAPRSAGTQRAAPATSGTAPLSLAPQAAPNTRVATTGPVTAPASVSPGAYMVQVASQRSEADAQASYRALQGKYPSVLGSRSPLIKRADLGDKGVYYRAMVGPFGSPDEASQFCGSLRSAGGQCVIQRN